MPDFVIDLDMCETTEGESNRHLVVAVHAASPPRATMIAHLLARKLYHPHAVEVRAIEPLGDKPFDTDWRGMNAIAYENFAGDPYANTDC